VESGGAALPHQANVRSGNLPMFATGFKLTSENQVFPDKEHFGRIFYNMVAPFP
jgi:hypothetical protein